jgi:hypothetical protein
LPRDLKADVNLVLMICDDELDRLAEDLPSKSSTAMRAISTEPGPARSA